MTWVSFPCPGSTPSWRYLPDGRIEIEGEGIPVRPWPAAMGQWRGLLTESAQVQGLPPHWLAAIMALETGGKSVCRRLADGSCSQREGAGVMQMLPSTAKGLAGRTVTSEELIANPALAIDLGARYLRQTLDANQGDFVMAATAYNAGSVKCGTGNVWRASSSEPAVKCPATSWGVVMGCVESPPRSGTIVVSDYPRAAIRYANAALANGFGAGAVAIAGTSPVALWFVGAAIGFWATKEALARRRSVAYR